jgi:hypothetical protein
MMADNEGIRSAFPAQPVARSSKLCVYEALFLLNRRVDQLSAILSNMMKFPFARKDSLQCAQDELEELRAGVNADLTEELANRERDDEGRFWRRRRAYEKKLEDPDDVYFDLERSERERRKKGLPPRIGLIPYSAISEKEGQCETAYKRRKTTSKKWRRD